MLEHLFGLSATSKHRMKFAGKQGGFNAVSFRTEQRFGLIVVEVEAAEVTKVQW